MTTCTSNDKDAKAFYDDHEYCILPGFFTAQECTELIAWSQYGFKNNNFWNVAASPDRHPLLGRINATLYGIFGKRYRFVQTAIHASTSSRPLRHDAHVDTVARFFRHSQNSSLQVWILLKGKDLEPGDTHLEVWSGFSPGASAKPLADTVAQLDKHPITGLSIGDIVFFNAWCPHATGYIDHDYYRLAMKIHYYAEDADVDDEFLRQNKMLPWSMVFENTHGGIEPLLFYLEHVGSGATRRTLTPPLYALRLLRMLLPDRRWRAFGPLLDGAQARPQDQ